MSGSIKRIFAAFGRPAARVLPSGQVRIMALAAVFITAQILIIVFAAMALEGVNSMRAYATGEAQWSKAQKRAVISLMHYAGSRDRRDLAEYHDAMTVIDGDSQARTALEKATPDFDAADRGFRAGLNAPDDTWGLSWGFVLLRNWQPFALAVADWRRADGLTSRMSYLSGQLSGAVESGAPLERVRGILADITALDHEFSKNEWLFSVHMGEASRAAKTMTVIATEAASLLVCLIVFFLVRLIAQRSMQAESRAKENESRMRDYVEMASDWYVELDKDLKIVAISPRFLRVAGVEVDDVVGRTWLTLENGFGLGATSANHREMVIRHLPFRDHLFKHETGGPVFFWSVSGKPLVDAQNAFTGYRLSAIEVTRYVRGIAMARDEAQWNPDDMKDRVATADIRRAVA
ncbi:MAG TPA: PAS domain-containing protein [Rhizomicrobium sp.]|nr:PAS domain-containing protein [Rhizomicrobium sp.]